MEDALYRLLAHVLRPRGVRDAAPAAPPVSRRDCAGGAAGAAAGERGAPAALQAPEHATAEAGPEPGPGPSAGAVARGCTWEPGSTPRDCLTENHRALLRELQGEERREVVRRIQNSRRVRFAAPLDTSSDDPQAPGSDCALPDTWRRTWNSQGALVGGSSPTTGSGAGQHRLSVRSMRASSWTGPRPAREADALAAAEALPSSRTRDEHQVAWLTPCFATSFSEQLKNDMSSCVDAFRLSAPPSMASAQQAYTPARRMSLRLAG